MGTSRSGQGPRELFILQVHHRRYDYLLFFSEVSQKWVTLRVPYRQKIILFIICFYASMHRPTILQNKILRIICSCLFFCPANIYRPSLEKVRFCRPNPNPLQPLNFYLTRKRKKAFCWELYALQRIKAWFSIMIFISFLKNIEKFVSKNLSIFFPIFIIIIHDFFFLNWASIQCC